MSPNGSISIVSEFVPGGPLDAYLQDNAATVSGGDMLSYALQVAKVSAVGRWAGEEGAVGRAGEVGGVGGERRCTGQEGGGWGRRERWVEQVGMRWAGNGGVRGKKEVDGAGGKRGEAMECVCCCARKCIPICNCSSMRLNGYHQYLLVVA